MHLDEISSIGHCVSTIQVCANFSAFSQTRRSHLDERVDPGQPHNAAPQHAQCCAATGGNSERFLWHLQWLVMDF
jgi:hypothetical protein